MEIVKPLKGPNDEGSNHEENYNDNFNVEEDSLKAQIKEEPKGFKKTYLIVVLMLVAILGYLGFTFLEKNETSKAEITPMLASSIKSENHSSAKEDEVKDLSTLASVAPEIKKVPKETPPVAIESTKEKVVSKEMIQETPTQEKVAVKQKTLVEKTETKPSKVQPLEIKLTKVKLVETPKPVMEKPKVVKAETVKKKTPNKKPRVVTVKKGDTLAIIAKKYYGNSMEFKHIVRANSKLKSEKTPLKLGQKLVVPYVKQTKTVKKKTSNKKPRSVTVKKGYSLAYISKKYYGDINQVQRIVAANPKIKNENTKLKIGQKIYLPR